MLYYMTLQTLNKLKGPRVMSLKMCYATICMIAVLFTAFPAFGKNTVKIPVRFDNIIENACTANNVDPLLVKALILRESRFNPAATGKAGEIGLMQIKHAVAKDWARAMGVNVPSKEELYDPYMNITIGVWYLSRALNRWQGRSTSTRLALFEYNAGRRTVITWIAHYDGDTRAVVDRGPSAKYIQTIMANMQTLKKIKKTSTVERIAVNP